MYLRYSKPKKLSNIEQLRKVTKFNQALELINKLEVQKGLTLQDQFDIHYLKSTLLHDLGHMNEALEYTELAYKESQQIKINRQIIDVLLSKSIILLRLTRINEALKTIIKAERILNTSNQLSLIEYKERYAYLVLLKGRCHINTGDFHRSLENADEVLKIAEEIKNDMLALQAVKLFVFNYGMKGDYERTLKTCKRYLALAKKVNDKQEMIGALNSLGMVLTEKNEFDQALDYLKQSLSICDEINSFKTAAVLGSLFDLYLNMNDLGKAQQYLDRMKQIRNQEDIKWFDDNYRLGKAQLLKKKPQDIDQLRAKEIFKQIVDEEGTFIEFNYVSLIHLCDSYLTELSKTNDLKVLDEIQPYITRLMDIAKSQQSFWLLVEGYSFQAKLKLITFEFKEAQKLITQALDMAKKYGENLLAERISMEQDELLKEKRSWETLRKSKAIMAERIELAHFNDQIVRMLRKRIYLKTVIE